VWPEGGERGDYPSPYHLVTQQLCWQPIIFMSFYFFIKKIEYEVVDWTQLARYGVQLY
jgi:hypothetical protein